MRSDCNKTKQHSMQQLRSSIRRRQISALKTNCTHSKANTNSTTTKANATAVETNNEQIPMTGAAALHLGSLASQTAWNSGTWRPCRVFNTMLCWGSVIVFDKCFHILKLFIRCHGRIKRAAGRTHTSTYISTLLLAAHFTIGGMKGNIKKRCDQCWDLWVVYNCLCTYIWVYISMFTHIFTSCTHVHKLVFRIRFLHEYFTI